MNRRWDLRLGRRVDLLISGALFTVAAILFSRGQQPAVLREAGVALIAGIFLLRRPAVETMLPLALTSAICMGASTFFRETYPHQMAIVLGDAHGLLYVLPWYGLARLLHLFFSEYGFPEGLEHAIRVEEEPTRWHRQIGRACDWSLATALTAFAVALCGQQVWHYVPKGDLFLGILWPLVTAGVAALPVACLVIRPRLWSFLLLVPLTLVYVVVTFIYCEISPDQVTGLVHRFGLYPLAMAPYGFARALHVALTRH